jgi:glycosyltransferase involved in cell wall biosynthesis
MKEENNIHVLNLVRWYPNRYDPMPGLFIQRHVDASAIYCKPAVVYTHQVEYDWKQSEKYDVDYQLVSHVPTAKVYYKASKCLFKPVRKIVNIFRFFKANLIGIKKVESEIEYFNIVHVHILTRLGLIALYYRFTRNIPFVITEHWSRYLDLTNNFNGPFRKLVTKYIVSKASSVTTVTQNLANSMKKHGLKNSNYLVLPNVVDDLFLKSDHGIYSGEVFNFIHISCFEDRSKNISGLLRVIKNLSDIRSDFIFTLVGDGEDFAAMQKYSMDLNIDQNIIKWTGLLEGVELVKELGLSQMLVIFSNYENFPVVINEALSMGIPVTATKVGGIPERINKENGILIEPGDEMSLLNSLTGVLDNKFTFNNQAIKQEFNKEFSPVNIGKSIYSIYKSAIT